MKRHYSLQPLSRDHHHSLLLCWKIRTGFSKGVAVERIKKYSDWFFENYIQPHFTVEEKFIFPVMGNDNTLVKKAMAEHRRLKRLFTNKDEIEKSLSLIEEELESHIRFEERVLFNEIQGIATEDQLELVTKYHKDQKFQENAMDEFWK